MSLFELRDVRMAFDGRVVLDLPRLDTFKAQLQHLRHRHGQHQSLDIAGEVFIQRGWLGHDLLPCVPVEPAPYRLAWGREETLA